MRFLLLYSAAALHSFSVVIGDTHLPDERIRLEWSTYSPALQVTSSPRTMDINKKHKEICKICCSRKQKASRCNQKFPR